MSEPNKYRDWILETIDSLRSRKARPDLERICRMVRRRHGSDPDRTRTEMEKLIKEQIVLKVSYKGSISYRNAAKVQRKSRKKSEFTAAGGGGGAETNREQTEHDHLNNNGDSAHSFSDQEEDSETIPDPNIQISPSATSKEAETDSSLRGGATTGCGVGSVGEEEKASAPTDTGPGQQAAGSLSPGLGHGSSAYDDADPSGRTPSKPAAVCGGAEPGRSGVDTHDQTCRGSLVNPSPQQRENQTAPLKSKLRVGGGGTKPAGDHANCALGDRLVDSVRSLSQQNLGRGPAAPSRGHMKPLGLKEILGYLSSQDQLSAEKLTRGKVKVVMEREVARGRLRRTRCGNIALPLRGSAAEDGSADGLLKGIPRDELPEKKENDPMETASEEEAQEGNGEEEEEEEEEDPRSSDEEAVLTPVAGTIESELIEKTGEGLELLKTSEEESAHHHHHHQQQGGAGVGGSTDLTVGTSVPDPLSRTPCPPVLDASLPRCIRAAVIKEIAVTPGQLSTEAQNQVQRDRTNHSSSGFDGSESKMEVGASSCLLTPTASPRDSFTSEERGMNGGVSSGGFIKSEASSGSPVDWTVSDVVSYFTAAGFPEQAAAFRTQEIDGKSLLLMQRNDVLTGLSIRLGPALKIYERHVKVLQKTHFEEDDC